MPIQIMENTPPNGGTRIILSADEIPDHLPHFRAFVTAVTEHINSRLTRDKLCITSDKNMKYAELGRRGVCMNNALECMASAELGNRSLLQFVEWGLAVRHEYLVPAMISIGGRPSPSCQISSPWMDLVVYREPGSISQIRGIVRWNERQMLADQAVLAGEKNVPTGVAMPLTIPELDHFIALYGDTIYPRQLADWGERHGLEISPELAEKAAQPVKEHNIPP
ncbi:MAG: hypothetical protein LBB55_02450, partial [Zoogloeaceae bacterium]|nr:hypothetical protein [Zoogloeaceae bacterium]